jgi:hypothetical protein
LRSNSKFREARSETAGFFCVVTNGSTPANYIQRQHSSFKPKIKLSLLRAVFIAPNFACYENFLENHVRPRSLPLECLDDVWWMKKVPVARPFCIL